MTDASALAEGLCLLHHVLARRVGEEDPDLGSLLDGDVLDELLEEGALRKRVYRSQEEP